MVRLPADAMVGVVQSLVDEGSDVRASGEVHVLAASPAHADQTGEPKLGEVLGGGRCGCTGKGAQGSDLPIAAR